MLTSPNRFLEQKNDSNFRISHTMIVMSWFQSPAKLYLILLLQNYLMNFFFLESIKDTCFDTQVRFSTQTSCDLHGIVWSGRHLVSKSSSGRRVLLQDWSLLNKFSICRKYILYDKLVAF